MSDTMLTRTSTMNPEPSIFEDEWKQSLDVFDINADLHASFLNAGDPFIDPQLLSTPASPASSFDAALSHEYIPATCNNDGADIGATSFDLGSGMICPVGTPASSHSDMSGRMDDAELEALLKTFENDHPYPAPSINSKCPSSPYFLDATSDNLGMPMSTFQSPRSMPVAQQQQQQAAKHAPSPLRHQMTRRSVSEPPTGPAHHLYQPPPGQMVFHRQGHYIGKPVPEEGSRIKGRARGRTLNRSHPYAVSRRGDESRGRAQRLPQASAPTSAPSPSMETTASSPAGDLVDETEFGRSVISIAVSEESLQKMITDAVVKAVGDLRDGNAVSPIETGGSESDNVVVGRRGETPRG